jgi:hypothetical protein
MKGGTLMNLNDELEVIDETIGEVEYRSAKFVNRTEVVKRKPGSNRDGNSGENHL